MSRVQSHAGRAQALQPGAQQRRCLHRFGIDVAAGADEGFEAECLAPGAHILRRKTGQSARHHVCGGAVFFYERRQRFVVGEVQAAASGNLELPPHARLVIEHGNGASGFGQNFSGPQTGWSAADNGKCV